MTMRRRLFGHMMGMPVSFFDKQSTGTLLSRITYDSEQVASSSSGALITVVREGASIIGLFIMMFYYSWQLSIILIVLAPIVSISIRVVSKRFRNISKNMQNTMGQVTTSAEQMLKGHKEVLIFGGQEVETKRFDKVSNRMRLQGLVGAMPVQTINVCVGNSSGRGDSMGSARTEMCHPDNDKRHASSHNRALSSTFHAIRMASLPGLRRISKSEAAAYSINAPSNILLIMREVL